jgi:hypothetical protein
MAEVFLWMLGCVWRLGTWCFRSTAEAVLDVALVLALKSAVVLALRVGACVQAYDRWKGRLRVARARGDESILRSDCEKTIACAKTLPFVPPSSINEADSRTAYDHRPAPRRYR